MTTLAEQDEVILIKDLRRLGPIDSEIRELAVSAANLIERLRAEREGLKKDAERWKNLHLPENTDALAEAALSVIVYDMGAFGTMLSAMSEDDRRDMKSGIAWAVRRAALTATHADEAKGEKAK